jgi:sortase (surface protein transpeptidase)
MKKVVLFAAFLLSVGSVFAQFQERNGVKSFIGASSHDTLFSNLQLTQTRNGVNGTFTLRSISVQVGMPFMGVIANVPQSTELSQYYQMDLGFPWGIRYRYTTFSEEAFSISKGYYSDKVNINWQIKANLNLISDFAIYRTMDINTSNPDWGAPIATLASSARSFDDVNTQGGKLYRYKVVARGVENVETIYSSFITGIGYRNPTGVITGNVSFNNGNPVKNVLISATPTGTTLNFGTSIRIPQHTAVGVNNLHKTLKDSLTLQAWVKPESNFDNDAINLFEIRSNLNNIKLFKVKLGMVNNRNTLSLIIEEPSMGDEVTTISDYIPSGEVDNKGADVLVPISNVNGSFTHFTVVLKNNAVPQFYINGRLINASYAAKMNTILASNAQPGTTAPTVVFSTQNIATRLNNSGSGDPQSYTKFNLGGGKTALLDEIRVWETALTPSQIQTDFRRYLKGNEAFLHTYITANEGTGKFAYDISSTGFDFHGNHADLTTNTARDARISTSPSGLVQTGLLVNLEPGQTSSYPGSGSSWTNIGTGGSTYNATLLNSPVYNNGYGGNLYFNGTNQSTQISRPVEDDFTLSAWIKTTSTEGVLNGAWQGIGIIDGEVPNIVNDFGLTMAQGRFMFGVGNPELTITSPNAYNDNNWHHIVCTRVKSTGAMVMYVDGVQVATGTSANRNSLTTTTVLKIGRSDAGRYFQGNISSINIYNNALTATQVQSNYTYFSRRFQEPVLSSFSSVIPTNTQLGILGVTDEFGNYVISSVPYTGNGNSYTIVPSLGVHKFNPTQQLAYVGVGSTVINNVNFKDISSFTFNGIAAYDSRGIFPTTSDAAIRGDIRDDEFYNAYRVGNQKYQKGEYWAFKNASGGIDSLRRYALIPVPGAQVNIDNQPVIDANNEPVLTDNNGRFSIQVPIGEHAITLVKNGHEFLHKGRFPANTTSVVNGQTVVTNTYQDFYQDQIEPITFIDTTKVTVIGRVVGGRVQAEQTIGFGENGRKVFNYTNAAGINDSTLYTSINNIGVARLTLGYIPVGSSSVTPEYRTSFQTNAQTGEFRVKLLPLSYTLSQNNLTFLSGRNPGDVPLLDQDKIINFTTINSFQTPTFTQGSTTIKGAPYQEVLKYTYFATPSFVTVSQSSDAQITADGNTYTIASDQTTPVYSQFGNYQINIRGQETYKNFDNSLTNPTVSTVPVSGGQLIVTNNLALANTESTDVSTTDSSIIVYSFKGGMPNTDAATGYKRTINLLYRLNGVDYPVSNYKNEGILLGGVSDGTQSFVTAGPQIPDFVLRDPPGANSSATIKKGSSFTFSRESTLESKVSSELAITAHLGFEISLGGSVTGPVAKTEKVNDFKAGIGFAQSSANGTSIENTYTFDQTISTSDDPAWVGSDADLYIGYSANQFYGTYNDLTSSRTPNSATPIKVVPPTGSTNNLVYPKMNTAMYFRESPEKTFFIYSQRSIIEDIIPKYQKIISQIDSGNIQQSTNGVLSRNHYVNSINLWKKIILNNEASKYSAFSDKELLKTSLNRTVDSLRDPVTQTFSPRTKSLKDLLDGTFYQNISFDAGVGEIAKSYEVERISSSKLSFNIELNKVLEAQVGVKFNATGVNIESKSSAAVEFGSSSNNSSKNTTNVSYSLKNNNSPGTLLSVDVINPFDGNGPIFITKGGQTSCPYEGAELSHYYKPNHANVTNPNATIVDLADQDRTPLSIATVPLELPEITVVSSNVSGVFDGRNAEFVLKLRNTSTINMDASFMLMVDQTTNPDNAKINIEPNGTIINIPAGQTVTYTMTLAKVKQDQFNYNNIKVLFKSLCDDNVKSSVLVSATFVPACSPVSVTAPSKNWLLNRNTAYDVVGNTQPLNISMRGYNTSFSSFQKISLEYKLKGTPDWTGLRTYYKNPADTATAIRGGDNNVELISGNQLNYSWDIAGRLLPDGMYEIRARTTCYNNTAFESEIIEGTVSLNAPVKFGTPTPTNGILGIGDDMTVRFNKPIKTNGNVTKFEFLVQQNQLPVRHEVSLAFNGSNNTATIKKPYITTGDFSIEFWMKNSSPNGTSTLLNQDGGGIKVELINNVLKYTIGGQSISSTILKDGKFNHYTLSYDASIPKLSIIENDIELTSTLAPNPTTTLSFTNLNPVVIGGNTFKGNIHDLRLWSKPITRDQSVANMNVSLTGSENGILGYWPMNEGNGKIAKDLARFKSLEIANANWDIFPKGQSYDFTGANYLTTNSNTFSKVIISKEMDATVSFWMKTAQSNATILSNGKGDTTDFVEGNQFRNKWAFNTNANGRLELAAEGRTYAFGNVAVNDNSWHHIAVSLTRFGGLQLYVDGNQMGSFATANIGGLASTRLFMGARGQSNATANAIDRYFVGQLDELCIWNMARTAEQIKEDMYFEQNFKTTGLLFYSNFNKPSVANSNGPIYYYPQNATTQSEDYALLNGQQLNFTDVSPAIKPFRPTESIVLNPVINNDQIVLVPAISNNWAIIEGKIAYITVSNLNDMFDNRQLSPVTWTAFINKNPIKMFVEGQGDVANLVKTTDSTLTFQITVVNQGGVAQPYTFNVPSWLTLSSNAGVIDPNRSITVTATVDMNLAPGIYNNLISLKTNYGIDKKVPLNLRVLVKEPVLTFKPSNYTQSMNIVGKIKLDGILSNDTYDRVYAVGPGTNGLEVRGRASLTYDRQLNAYYVFLTVYSNVVSGESINFFIWDASQGNFLEAKLDTSVAVPFVADRVIGNFTTPSIFENTNIAGQLVNLNQGWTWVSFNVNDPRFASLNVLTAGANLSTSDLVQSNSPALFDSYQFFAPGSASNGWSGGISTNGGISNNKMYKFYLANVNDLKLKGVPADLNTWSFSLQAGWNWLPYVANKNIPIGEALANLNPSEGDLIKSQNLFSIYSSVAKAWKGSLTYLNQSEGYMINVANAQTLTYPSYLNKVNEALPYIQIIGEQKVVVNGGGNPSDAIFINHDTRSTPTIAADYSKFASNMNAVVKLPEGFNELYFYNDAGELRGNTKTMKVDGKDLAFITIYGDKPEHLTAFIGANNAKQATSKTFNFSSDAIWGSIARPIVIELPKNEISIYPNPFQEELKVAINAKEKGEAKVTIYNLATSQTCYSNVFKVNAGANVFKLRPNVPAGAYVVNVKIGELVLFNKVIKIN